MAPTPPSQASPLAPVSPDLTAALQDLAVRQAEYIEDLATRARRGAEMAATLPPGPLRADAEARHAEHARALAAAIASWLTLGGRIRLEPPPGAEAPPPAAPALPTPIEPVALPSPPDPPAAPSAPTPEPRVARPVEEVRRPPPRVPPPPPPPAGPWAEDLTGLLRDLALSANTQEEMDTIQQAANASFTRWAPYPRPVQRALVGNLACRLRHLQDHLGISGARLDTAFRSLTRFSKSFQPGWVNGLTRGRGPAADSWADEARTWWDQLRLSAESGEARPEAAIPEPVVQIEEHLEAIRRWIQEWRVAPNVAKGMCLDKSLDAIRKARDAGVPPTHPGLCALAGEIYDHLDVSTFRALRQAIRDLEMAEREERGGETPKPIPPSWAWWSHTVGRRALLVGGEPSDPHRACVEEAFGFAALRWEALPDAEAVQRLRERILGGESDLVVVVASGLASGADRPIIRAAQEAGIPWVHVEQGQGVTRVRMAIERYLQPDGQPVAEP